MASGYSDLSEIRKDGATRYGLDQKPPKINLLNERPRRKSSIEQQLTSRIIRSDLSQQQPSQQQQVHGDYSSNNNNNNQQAFSKQRSQYDYNTTPIRLMMGDQRQPPQSAGFNTSYDFQSQQQHRQQSSDLYSQNTGLQVAGSSSFHGPSGSGNWSSPQSTSYVTTTVRTEATTADRTAQAPTRAGNTVNNSAGTSSATLYTDLVHDLAEKEAKLKREMAYINEQLSPWSRPRVIREPRREPPPRQYRSEQRWARECPPSGSSSRPNSRASSTRSTAEADLMEKAAKLLLDVEEMEKKPLKTQQILIESGARPSGSRPSSSNASASPIANASSIHTAIIKVPRDEIDNKSPLPFSYDNFSTLGVRGNIASVGAAPPEKPFAPIFPVIKRTPSPSASKRY